MKFYILKTMKGDFYFNILAPKYDSINTYENKNELWINNRMIPYSNIDFLLNNLPFDDFIRYGLQYNLNHYDSDKFMEIVDIYNEKN